MKKSYLLISAFAAIFWLCGCADPVLFSEVFQLEQGQKLYTRHNLWYSDPQQISCLNIQNGSFIPAGTEIIPVETTWFGDNIRFKNAKTGELFTIKFNEGYTLCTMSDYIAATFTTDTPEKLFKEIRKQALPRVIRGEVVRGMNEKEVLLAYGPPPALRTPDRRIQSWLYYKDQENTFRLVFRNGIVRNIIYQPSAK